MSETLCRSNSDHNYKGVHHICLGFLSNCRTQSIRSSVLQERFDGIFQEMFEMVKGLPFTLWDAETKMPLIFPKWNE